MRDLPLATMLATRFLLLIAFIKTFQQRSDHLLCRLLTLFDLVNSCFFGLLFCFLCGSGSCFKFLMFDPHKLVDAFSGRSGLFKDLFLNFSIRKSHDDPRILGICRRVFLFGTLRHERAVGGENECKCSSEEGA